MPNHSSRPKRPVDINQLAKAIVDQATAEPEPFSVPPAPSDSTTPVKDPAAVSLGRRGGLKGGKVRAARLTPEQRVEIAKKAAAARWGKGKG